MAELDFRFTRDPSPEQIAAMGVAAALRPLETLGEGAVNRAAVENQRAHQAAVVAANRAYQQAMAEAAEGRAEKREIAREDRKKKLSDEDRMLAMRVQAAGLGIDTAGKNEEQLAADIGNAQRTLKVAEENRVLSARDAEAKRQLGLDPDATPEEMAAASAKLEVFGKTAGRRAEEAVASQWLARPENAPFVQQWNDLHAAQDRLIGEGFADLWQMPPPDKVAVGAAVLASPEIKDLRLTPQQEQVIRSGNWMMLTQQGSKLKPDVARTITETAFAASEKLADQGLLITQAQQLNAARSAGPKLEAVRRSMEALKVAHPELIHSVPMPAPDGELPMTRQGAADGRPPLPMGFPSAATPSVAAPPAMDERQADRLDFVGPASPKDAFIQLARQQARHGRPPVVQSLYDSAAERLAIQPEQVGASSFYRSPGTVMGGNLEQYAPMFDALPEETKNRLYLEAMSAGR